MAQKFLTDINVKGNINVTGDVTSSNVETTSLKLGDVVVNLPEGATGSVTVATSADVSTINQSLQTKQETIVVAEGSGLTKAEDGKTLGIDTTVIATVDSVSVAQAAADAASKAASDEASRAAGVEADLQSQIDAVKSTADAAAKQTDLTALSETVSEHSTKLSEIDGQISTISGNLLNVTEAASNAQDTADANKPVAGTGISVAPIAENGGQTVSIDSTVVATLSDTQTITGAKTFTTSITLPESNAGAQNAITRAEAEAIASAKADSVKVSGSEYIDVAEGNIISVKSTVATTDKEQTFDETVTFSKPIVGTLEGLTTSIDDLNRLIEIENAAKAKQDPISVAEGLTLESDLIGIDNTVVPMLSGTEVKVGTTVLASTTDVDNKIADKILNTASADWTADDKVPTLKAVADKITAAHAGVMSYKGVINVTADSTEETVAADIATKAPIVAGDFFIVSASGDITVSVDGSVLSSNDLIIASEAMETVDLAKFELVGINDATVVNTTSEQDIEGLKKFKTVPQVYLEETDTHSAGWYEVATAAALQDAIESGVVGDEVTISTGADAKLSVIDYSKFLKANSDITGTSVDLTGKEISVDTPDETETTLIANVEYVNAKVDAVTPVAGTGITIDTDKSISVDASVITTTSSHTNSSNGPIAGNLDFTGTLQKLPTVEASSTYSTIATIADIEALIRAAAPTTKKTYVSGTDGDFVNQSDGKTSVWVITPAAEDKTLESADVTCTVRSNDGELVYPEIKFEANKITITANTAALEGITPLSVTVVA